MTCRSVMLAEPVSIRSDASVAESIDFMFRHHIRTLPVVDEQGRYLGLFGVHFLLKLLLPKAATLNDDQGLSDLAFVHDTLDDVRSGLKESLQALYPQAIASIVHTEIPPLSPEDSVMEAMLRIYRSGCSLPVVDKKTKKLVGVITHWSILAKLTGHNG